MATQLTITPDFLRKTSVVTGLVAVGEKVSLTVIGVDDPTGLRVRIRFAQTEVAMFPLLESDTWNSDGTNAMGTIDLNTVEFRHFFEGLDDKARLPCILIVENNESPENLYAVTNIAVMNWAAIPGDQVPVAIGTFKDDLQAVQGIVGVLEEAIELIQGFNEGHNHANGYGRTLEHDNLSGTGVLTHDEIDMEVAALRSSINSYDGELAGHKDREDNPHSVTKLQLGLVNVDNTSDANKPISDAVREALNAKLEESDLTAHTDLAKNPHSVTKLQLGLGNVDNTSDANKPISDAVREALNTKADSTSLVGHQTNKEDPHETLNTIAVMFAEIDDPYDIDGLFDVVTQMLNKLKGF